ncbi:MAG: NAD(P) transhydrogenase subunit alpha [Planctomycetota bacterium]
MDNVFLIIFVFVIASLLGFELITKVPPTLHTPLMSGSNAISGITIVGAIICARDLSNPVLSGGWFANLLAFLAISFATINVVGGYMVTDRMLGSFRKKGK